MRRALIAGLVVVASVVVTGPAEGAPGLPPLRTSPNVKLLTNVPGSYAGITFQGHYAYATSWTAGLTVFDISQPASPTPVGVLPLPHFENEDVDLCGNTLLISNDREAKDFGGILYVIDITQPARPTLLSSLPLGLTGDGRGPGHIANFVKADCSQAWIDGGDDVEVVDLSSRAAPKSLGTFTSYAAVGPDPARLPAFVVTHDTERDSTGMLWQVGGGGLAGYKLTSDPLKPKLVTSSGVEGVNIDFTGANSPYNDFILHNSKRAGSTLLVTEEDYIDSNGDDEQPGSCNGQGKFETWKIATGKGSMRPLDTWKTELNGFLAGGSADSKAPATVNCSSHWFEYRNGVAAVGWYEQGVRFLDVRNPSNIRQIGYYLPADGATWAAYWVPGAKDIVYTADPARGLDVLRISKGGDAAAPTVVAPMLDEWFGTPGTRPGMAGYEPTPLYGYSCVLPKP
jgi:hypothetical protein